MPETCPRTGQSTKGGPCGTRIDRYEIQRLLGDGGMGAVYRARHVMLNQPVAVKLLHAEFARRNDMLERFLREARAAASIGNPHIIRVIDCGATSEGRPFLVMELLDGEGIDAMLRREKRLAPPRVVDLGVQCLDGLGAAHAAGIIHRDMKPANLFVRRTTDPARPEFVTILDFGISKMSDTSAGPHQNITQTGAVIGTPVYMAPEQIMNPKEVDHRVDLYATAVMLYEMLSGRLPYEGINPAELIMKACTTAPTPLKEIAPDVPAGLVAVIDRAMARDPGARFQSASEFAEALRRSLGGQHSLPTAPQGSGTSTTPWSAAIPATVAVPQVQTPTAEPAATPSFVPSVQTPTGSSAHWGAISPPSAPNLAAAPQSFVPVSRREETGRTLRTVGILMAVLAVLAALCCFGTIGLGWFASRDDHAQPATQPQMTPIGPAQRPTGPQMVPQQPQMVPQQPQMVPQQPQMVPQQPQMVPIGHTTNVVPTVPQTDPIEVSPPHVIGTVSSDAVEDALNEVRNSMHRCRTSTPQSVTVLAIVQSNGRVSIARPADENTGDANVAQCVANRLRSMRVAHAGGSGIVQVTVRLMAL